MPQSSRASWPARTSDQWDGYSDHYVPPEYKTPYWEVEDRLDGFVSVDPAMTRVPEHPAYADPRTLARSSPEAGQADSKGEWLGTPASSSQRAEVAPTESEVKSAQQALAELRAMTGADRPAAAAGTMAVDVNHRVLSYIHWKNLEAIEIGGLAQARAVAPAIREHGQRLVRDHLAVDQQVLEIANGLNLTLLTPNEIARLMQNEASGTVAASAKGTNRLSDPVASLRKLDGSAFDQAMTQRLRGAQADVLQSLRKHRDLFIDSRVAELIDQLVPVIERHETSALALPVS